MDEKLLERITVNPEVMVGKPTIRGTRVTVEVLLEMIAAGVAQHEILANYPGLEPEDLRAAVAYGLKLLQKEQRSKRSA